MTVSMPGRQCQTLSGLRKASGTVAAPRQTAPGKPEDRLEVRFRGEKASRAGEQILEQVTHDAGRAWRWRLVRIREGDPLSASGKELSFTLEGTRYTLRRVSHYADKERPAKTTGREISLTVQPRNAEAVTYPLTPDVYEYAFDVLYRVGQKSIALNTWLEAAPEVKGWMYEEEKETRRLSAWLGGDLYTLTRWRDHEGDMRYDLRIRHASSVEGITSYPLRASEYEHMFEGLFPEAKKYLGHWYRMGDDLKPTVLLETLSDRVKEGEQASYLVLSGNPGESWLSMYIEDRRIRVEVHETPDYPPLLTMQWEDSHSPLQLYLNTPEDIRAYEALKALVRENQGKPD